ncbi:adhesion G-protein coupled receptor G2 isoform X9 [Bufo gargarizans]|uniref:adhesion G-protein coupled receptor G2 isoform X9 n=1 Tax=Bufo gargarizans TaxID=30331 RepID=UPI001CF1991C|nr:adhesion G-protein coupled receptor G2 isoform X9 [Bufo gargarizans]
MLLRGFLSAITGKARHRPVKLKNIQPICILMCLLTAHAAKFDFKAVFSAPCVDIMTLSTPVPEMTEFTVCTYIQLDSSDPWTAFTYQLPTSPTNSYEFGLLGDSSSMKIWMFGTEITVFERLKAHTWYEVCIMWDGSNDSMGFYLDGTLKESRKLENSTKLDGGGSVVLGCSHFKDINASASVGLVGNIYMFRMWDRAQTSLFQKCVDGKVIKWRKEDWIYISTVVQTDSSLHCAKGTDPSTSGQINHNIHMFYKRSLRVSGSTTSVPPISPPNTPTTVVSGIVTGGTGVNTRETKTLTTGSNTFLETTNITNVTEFTIGTSKSSTLWTSSLNTIVTNGSSSWSSGVTSQHTYLTSEFSQITTESMNCSFNDTEAFQNWHSDICNTSCDYGSAYEIILQKDCALAEHTLKNLFLKNTSITFIVNNNCSVLALGLNDTVLDICSTLNNPVIIQYILSLKTLDYYCCCLEECSIPNCVDSTLTCPPGGSVTTGVKSTTFNNTGLTIATTFMNGSGTTVYSGPSATFTKGSSATFNSGPITAFNNATITSEVTLTVNSKSKTTLNSGDDLKILAALLSSSNLNSSTVAYIVSKLEKHLSGEVSPHDAEALLNILSTFLNISQALLGPVSNRLIRMVNKIALQLTFPGKCLSLTSQSLALAVNKVNVSSFIGTSFSVNSSSGLQVSLGSQAPANSDGSVLLPASLINDLSPGDKKNASRVQFNYYAKTSFFKDSSLTTNQQLVSKVISSSVANLSVTNLSENITVTLKTSPRNGTEKVDCVFWDFNQNNGSGGWSSYGCVVANTTQNETVCQCNHMTSFAILMNVSPNDQLNPQDLLVLTFITYIGCGLSAIFLSVTLITYIAFEKIRRDYPSKILIQLCAALVCLNLTFLLNPWIALYNDVPGLCISVAAFLHYFVLVSITWMGLEAFHMYLSLVKVFNTYVRKYILKFCIVGWGAPAVVVAIILAVKKDAYYLQISGKYPNGSADYFCWVEDIVFWITVVGYFAIIFLLNVSMFVVVLIQLCRIKKQKQLGYQRKTTLQDMRSVAGITFLLGITWGFGFFSFGPGRTVIMYLFTIFNSLQGFFIFLFYCVAKENVRKQWRRYLCCGKFRLAENSDWSKTATNKLRKQTSKQGVSSSSSNSIQSTSNTNSTTLLVANEYSVHPNGNGNVYKERNGVSFKLENGEMPLQEFSGRPSIKNGDVHQNALRRTSNRGSVHFIDQI